MKIIKNSLSPELSQSCLDEIKNLQNDYNWRSSTICWPDSIKIGISGSCLIANINKNFNNKIIDEVKQYLPELLDDITTMFYIWQPNSGMSRHLDSAYKFAATIYLNPYWNIEWGGNFLYYSKCRVDSTTSEEDYMYDHENWKIIVPENRTMVINTNKMLHMVTPISPFCPELRYTIQIFGS